MNKKPLAVANVATVLERLPLSFVVVLREQEQLQHLAGPVINFIVRPGLQLLICP